MSESEVAVGGDVVSEGDFAEAPAHSQRRLVARPLAGVRCLVVDADETSGEQQVGLFVNAGASVTRRARSLAGGIEAFRACDWDLVLIELGLPDGCGFPLAEEIAASARRLAMVIHSEQPALLAQLRVHRIGAIVVTKLRFPEYLLAVASAALAAMGRGPLGNEAEHPEPQGSEPRGARKGEFAWIPGPPGTTHRFTRRQREILRLLTLGRAPKVIASELGISHSTVRFHASELYRRCGVTNQRELLALLARTGGRG